MSVDGSGPLGWATLLDRAGGGDSHRVRVLRVERSDGCHEHGVVAYGARQAGDPLRPGGQAVLPEIPESMSGFRAEAECRAGAGSVTLRRQRRQRREAEGRDQACAAQRSTGQ